MTKATLYSQTINKILNVGIFKYLLKETANRASLYLIFSEICLFVGIGACVAILPRGLYINIGASYYGVHLKTLIPYTLGLVLSAYFVWLAAKELSSSYPEIVFKWILYMVACLILCIVATPYTANHLISNAHNTMGIALFFIQFIFSYWLILWVYRDPINVLIVIGLSIAGISAFIYNENPHGFLIEGQLLCQLFFSILLIRTIIYLVTKNKINVPVTNRKKRGDRG